jgi:hypothetical protein
MTQVRNFRKSHRLVPQHHESIKKLVQKKKKNKV